MSEQTEMQTELENKKRKAEKDASSRGQINEYFQRSPKTTTPSALRTSTQVVAPKEKELEEPKESKCKGRAVTCLHIFIDVPPDKDCTGRHRSVLTKLFTSMKLADPAAVMLPHEPVLERSTEEEVTEVKVEDHDNLLVQVKELCNSADIEPASVLHQHKNRLNKVSTGTLRGIVHELLATVGIETRNSSFHNDLLKHPRSKRCDLTPTVMSMRDRATVRRHDQTKRSKRKREDYEDMIEVETSQQRRRRR